MTDNPQNTVGTALTFPCPSCKQPSKWQDNPHRPFCSARCKAGDFLAWANEEHCIVEELGEIVEEEDEWK